MKKIILCAVLFLSGIYTGADARSSHAVSKQNSAVTVVSDTTGNADADEADEDADEPGTASFQAQIDSAVQQAVNRAGADDADDMSDASSFGPFGSKGDNFVIWIVLIVFGLPVLLIAVILYFVFRNRKEKYELQKMAIEKGLNPNTVYYTGNQTETKEANMTSGTTASSNVNPAAFGNLSDSMTPDNVLWEKGVKQMCLGAGVALLLGFIVDAEFSLVGVLVFFLGLGKVIIARNRQNRGGDTGNIDVNQRYDTAGKPTTTEEYNASDMKDEK